MTITLSCACGSTARIECDGNDPFQRDGMLKMAAAWNAMHHCPPALSVLGEVSAPKDGA